VFDKPVDIRTIHTTITERATFINLYLQDLLAKTPVSLHLAFGFRLAVHAVDASATESHKALLRSCFRTFWYTFNPPSSQHGPGTVYPRRQGHPHWRVTNEAVKRG
jgi:hypothetical protein